MQLVFTNVWLTSWSQLRSNGCSYKNNNEMMMMMMMMMMLPLMGICSSLQGQNCFKLLSLERPYTIFSLIWQCPNVED